MRYVSPEICSGDRSGATAVIGKSSTWRRRSFSAAEQRAGRTCGVRPSPKKVKSGTAGSLNMRFWLPEPGVSFTTAHVCRLYPIGRDLDCRALCLRVCRRRELLLVILVFGGIDETSFLHRCIGCGVTDRVVCAGPQPRFLLVLLALPAARILCGTTCRRDIL